MKQKRVKKVIRQDKAHWVGTGFFVHQIFPRATGVSFLEDFSPFLVLDYNAPMTYPATKYFKGIGPHPHRGLETVTFVLEGSLKHKDNAGNEGIIHSGDVQWMTAGDGILHKEYHEKEWAKVNRTFHVIQLWVNLPAKDKRTPPKYQSLRKDEMGVLENDDFKLIVYSGEVLKTEGPAESFSPMDLFKVELKKDKKIELPIKENYNTGFLVLKGSVKLGTGEQYPEKDFVVLENDGDGILLEGLEEENEVFFFSGEPLNEPLAISGTFAMNTEKELQEAKEDYRQGVFGTEDF